MTRIFLDEIEKLLLAAHLRYDDWFRCDDRRVPRPRLGAVSFLHRFGSGLNRHTHLHAAVTDGWLGTRFLALPGSA